MPDLGNELRERWKWLVGLGAVAVAGGLVAIAVPAAVSVATAIFIGWILVFSGAVQLVRSCLSREIGRIVLRLAGAAVALCAGAYLILIPLGGTITLTVVLVSMFVLTGAARIAVGVRDRHHAPARGMIASGLAAMLIGILLLAHLPSSADWAIGLLVGVDLVLAGVGSIQAGLEGRSLARMTG